jgi:hypothetical protein
LLALISSLASASSQSAQVLRIRGGPTFCTNGSSTYPNRLRPNDRCFGVLIAYRLPVFFHDATARSATAPTCDHHAEFSGSRASRAMTEPRNRRNDTQWTTTSSNEFQGVWLSVETNPAMKESVDIQAPALGSDRINCWSAEKLTGALAGGGNSSNCNLIDTGSAITLPNTLSGDFDLNRSE